MERVVRIRAWVVMVVAMQHVPYPMIHTQILALHPRQVEESTVQLQGVMVVLTKFFIVLHLIQNGPIASRLHHAHIRV